MPQRAKSQTPTVPICHASLWIAGDSGQTKIGASGRSFAEAKEKATAAGESDPALAKVPKAGVRYVGGSVPCICRSALLPSSS